MIVNAFATAFSSNGKLLVYSGQLFAAVGGLGVLKKRL